MKESRDNLGTFFILFIFIYLENRVIQKTCIGRKMCFIPSPIFTRNIFLSGRYLMNYSKPSLIGINWGDYPDYAIIRLNRQCRRK
jgi:hypothetical protein